MFRILKRWFHWGGVLWQGPLESFALEIFGGRRVVTARQAMSVWRKNPPHVGRLAIRYREETLINCANENKADEAQWALVWTLGLSLRAQLNIMQSHRYDIRCFDVSRAQGHYWWTREPEMRWAQRGLDEGCYRLLDFSGRFGDMQWREQEACIARVGSAVRAAESIVTEAAISYVITRDTPLDVFPLESWYHWGPTLDSQGRRVRVGEFNGRGMVINAEPEENHDPRLRVVLERNPDF